MLADHLILLIHYLNLFQIIYLIHFRISNRLITLITSQTYKKIYYQFLSI